MLSMINTAEAQDYIGLTESWVVCKGIIGGAGRCPDVIREEFRVGFEGRYFQAFLQDEEDLLGKLRVDGLANWGDFSIFSKENVLVAAYGCKKIKIGLACNEIRLDGTLEPKDFILNLISSLALQNDLAHARKLDHIRTETFFRYVMAQSSQSDFPKWIYPQGLHFDNMLLWTSSHQTQSNVIQSAPTGSEKLGNFILYLTFTNYVNLSLLGENDKGFLCNLRLVSKKTAMLLGSNPLIVDAFYTRAAITGVFVNALFYCREVLRSAVLPQLYTFQEYCGMVAELIPNELVQFWDEPNWVWYYCDVLRVYAGIDIRFDDAHGDDNGVLDLAYTLSNIFERKDILLALELGCPLANDSAFAATMLEYYVQAPHNSPLCTGNFAEDILYLQYPWVYPRRLRDPRWILPISLEERYEPSARNCGDAVDSIVKYPVIRDIKLEHRDLMWYDDIVSETPYVLRFHPGLTDICGTVSRLDDDALIAKFESLSLQETRAIDRRTYVANVTSTIGNPVMELSDLIAPNGVPDLVTNSPWYLGYQHPPGQVWDADFGGYADEDDHYGGNYYAEDDQ